ncbi:hypothetical protein RSAG8_09169, partial [Rhizoctonia solani AG-8 WAC10335]
KELELLSSTNPKQLKSQAKSKTFRLVLPNRSLMLHPCRGTSMRLRVPIQGFWSKGVRGSSTSEVENGYAFPISLVTHMRKVIPSEGCCYICVHWLWV